MNKLILTKPVQTTEEVINELIKKVKQDTKQQILNLECLKEEEETCVKEDVLGNEYLVTDNIKVGRNQLREEIKEEIKKL